MSNQMYGNTWYADSVGILTRSGISLKAVTWVPNAVDDAMLFTFYQENVKEATSGTLFGTAVTGTITNQYTMTFSAGTLLPSSIAIGDFFAITDSSGSEDNYYKKAGNKLYTQVVKTAGNNTVIEVAGTTSTPWTNESTKKYAFSVFTGLKAISFKAEKAADMEHSIHITFPGGHHFPNLAVASVSSSAYAILYLV